MPQVIKLYRLTDGKTQKGRQHQGTRQTARPHLCALAVIKHTHTLVQAHSGCKSLRGNAYVDMHASYGVCVIVHE